MSAAFCGMYVFVYFVSAFFFFLEHSRMRETARKCYSSSTYIDLVRVWTSEGASMRTFGLWMLLVETKGLTKRRIVCFPVTTMIGRVQAEL